MQYQLVMSPLSPISTMQSAAGRAPFVLPLSSVGKVVHLQIPRAISCLSLGDLNRTNKRNVGDLPSDSTRAMACLPNRDYFPCGSCRRPAPADARLDRPERFCERLCCVRASHCTGSACLCHSAGLGRAAATPADWAPGAITERTTGGLQLDFDVRPPRAAGAAHRTGRARFIS
jgi:hypothetical protein